MSRGTGKPQHHEPDVDPEEVPFDPAVQLHHLGQDRGPGGEG